MQRIMQTNLQTSSTPTRLLIAPIVAWLALAGTGCDQRTSIKPSDLDHSVASVDSSLGSTLPDSHQRMIETLEGIRRENRYEKLFQGPMSVDELENNLPRVRLAPKEMQIEFFDMLGSYRMWLGDTPEAIEHYKQARSLVASQGRSKGAAWQAATYKLGLAFLRLGENENCVDCNNGDSCLFPITAGGIHEQQEGSLAAITLFEELLALEPDHPRARWLLNVATMTLGKYPDGVPEQYRIAPERLSSEIDFPRFPNVAAAQGVNNRNCSGGSVVDDFDGDGDLDWLTSSWGLGDPLTYYRNDGERFSIVDNRETGLEGIYGGLNLIHADYDNDGDVDIFVLRGAWLGSAGEIPNSLLNNDGQGRFRDVTYEVGLADAFHPTQTAAWIDFDNDGDLDLFIGNEHAACQLFENDRGAFRDVASIAGITHIGFTKGVACGDINGDRYPEIYVSNQDGSNQLYLNNRDGTFTDIAVRAGVTGPFMSFGTWFWDYNQDGNLDLFVASYSYGPSYVSNKYFGETPAAEQAALYRGDGRGNFENVALDVNLTEYTQPMGCNYGDLNNDGYPDFYLSTGYPDYDAMMPNVMYLNNGGQRFIDVTTSGGFGHLQKGHGVTFADYDNDGDQDVFAEMGGAFPGDQAVNVLFNNPGFGRNWLKLKLVGSKTNRSAIGAKISIKLDDAGQDRTVYGWVTSGSSFGGNPLMQHLGLGAATRIKELKIEWPSSEPIQIFTDVTVNQSIEISEGETHYASQTRRGG
jgi:hypothetical protein